MASAAAEVGGAPSLGLLKSCTPCPAVADSPLSVILFFPATDTMSPMFADPHPLTSCLPCSTFVAHQLWLTENASMLGLGSAMLVVAEGRSKDRNGKAISNAVSSRPELLLDAASPDHYMVICIFWLLIVGPVVFFTCVKLSHS